MMRFGNTAMPPDYLLREHLPFSRDNRELRVLSSARLDERTFLLHLLRFSQWNIRARPRFVLTMLHVERIRGRELPTDLRDDWNRVAGDIPFRRWEWLANWWKHFGAGRDLFVLIARDDQGAVRGIAPWQVRNSLAGGRVIEALGNGKACSDYLSLLCDNQDANPVAEAFATWLADANRSSNTRPGDSWELLLLCDVAEGDESIRELKKSLIARGCAAHDRAGMRAWRVPLLGDWEKYLASLSKPVRRQARRTLKRLQEECEIAHHEVTDPQSFERGFSILVDLHQRRWEEIGIEGCFTDERFTKFLRDACLEFLAQRKLHLSWLEHLGKPIVVNIEFEGGDIDYVYQGGMDPESRSMSPGWMHMVHLFQRSIALGKTHRDYLRGDEPYKKHWRGVPTQLMDLRIVPSHASARMRFGNWEIP
jgi:CelD/BcsL family acetyltransferase involved in cellulose biosynthesis